MTMTEQHTVEEWENLLADHERVMRLPPKPARNHSVIYRLPAIMAHSTSRPPAPVMSDSVAQAMAEVFTKDAERKRAEAEPPKYPVQVFKAPEGAVQKFNASDFPNSGSDKRYGLGVVRSPFSMTD